MAKVKEEVFKHHPRMEGWKKTLLFLPVLLSVSSILVLKYSDRAPYYGMELMAPVDTTPLMVALVLFTTGYIIFLLFMFSEDIRDFIWKARH